MSIFEEKYSKLLEDLKKKLEYYCAYQERSHLEVTAKLKLLKANSDEIDLILVHLIEHNFLNEERFACAFARGKHNIKKWGKVRIVNELKFLNISKFNIDSALKEISIENYLTTFHDLTEKQWQVINEPNIQKKKKKFCDYLLRKGWESHLIFEKLQELEAIDNK